MAKKLFIDMYKCDECEECTVQCDYKYQPGLTDHGIRALREEVAYLFTCRRCEEPSCVAACKFDALERQDNGVLKRYNLRCVGCKCCSQACPFGTIFPELVPFYAVKCDYCLDKGEEREMSCVTTCAKNAVEFKEVDESEEDVCIVNNHLAVRAPKWEKKEV